MDKSKYSFDKYKDDSLRAIDARFEAQKIAFAPMTFQAIRAMIELGILISLKIPVTTESQSPTLQKKQTLRNTVWAFFAKWHLE